jgi:two-component system, LytTR family, sensor kinase
MEYDNDRRIYPPHKMEIFYWVFLCLLNPLVNTMTFFWWDPVFGFVLLLANLLTIPLYFLFARFIVPRFFFAYQPFYFLLISLSFFFVTLCFLTGINSLIAGFPMNPQEQFYFTYSSRTLSRDSLWVLANMILAFTVAFLKKFFDEKEQILQLQKDNNLFKLKYLQSQLNPHFLFNTLNSIYSLSLQKSDKAPEVIVRLADIMRYLIYDCNEPRILLDKEIEFIRNYIEIEKIRYSADVQFTVEGSTSGIMIEPFLFISFIENGFKHAMNDSSPNPFIYVTLKVGEKQIVLNVVNNTDIDLETQAKRINGTSIKNSKSLLELLYPDSYALDIIQTDTQTKKKSDARIRNARERLKMLYPDTHTLDVILSNNAFTVSLIVNPHGA